MELDHTAIRYRVSYTIQGPDLQKLIPISSAQPFGKISVSIFLIKLMGPNDFWRKWFLYVNMVVFSILACLCVIFTYAQCNPSRALWEMVPGAKCWKTEVQVNFSIFTTGEMHTWSIRFIHLYFADSECSIWCHVWLLTKSASNYNVLESQDRCQT